MMRSRRLDLARFGSIWVNSVATREELGADYRKHFQAQGLETERKCV